MEQLMDIAGIRTDGDTQSRVEISPEVVAEYAAAMARDETFPPVSVYFDSTNYWLARGFHRLHAATQAGRTQIRALVLRGTVEDARWHAAGDNIRHGLRRTPADIRRAGQMALKCPQATGKSNAELAKHLGVSENTVLNWRKDLKVGNPYAKTAERRDPQIADSSRKPLQDKDPNFQSAPTPGDLDNIPMGPSGGDSAAEWVADKRKRGYDDARIRILLKARPADERARIMELLGGDQAPAETDAVGVKLPENVVGAFGRAQEIQDLMTLVSQVKSRVLEAVEAKDPLFLDVNPSQFKAEAENLYRSLHALKPYAVCPYCGGVGCRACLKRGWVGEFTYVASPAAKKARRRDAEGAKKAGK